ncbi:hypothetical protein KUTeg_010621 [Tegillarca granosa]|uniref:Uncharacterized protein n=1 Tax=Tegillarca granosa TaxID=220873 RepID=A0ABQ9F359_TEGGR|nr:hypothetical protein KUTeg_010621 [Tegillarca granosa]
MIFVLLMYSIYRRVTLLSSPCVDFCNFERELIVCYKNFRSILIQVIYGINIEIKKMYNWSLDSALVFVSV